MNYFSHRTRKALAEGHTYLPLGFAHYSYGSVCQKFQRLFKEGGLSAQELIRPEIYAKASDVPGEITGRPLHIAFKPYEEIRLLKGAANVAHVAWEFDRLPSFAGLPFDHPRRANMLNDYVHMLSLVSEIWVGCDYTKRVFEAQGLAHVEIMPAPIETGRAPPERLPLIGAMRQIGCLELTRNAMAAVLEGSITPRLDRVTLFRAAETRATGGRVFLSVFNPGDPRKNVAALLLGFQEFQSQRKHRDLLIIKLVLPASADSLRDALTKDLPKYFDYSGVPFSFLDCGNIVVVPEHLSTEDLASLYQAADFYVCTSAAEGQGLPLQEAMAAGLVPISPAVTAMEDYVKDNHAIIMQPKRAPIPMSVAQAYGLSDLSWKLVDSHEVVLALTKAVALSPMEYQRRARAAWKFIHDNYGFDAIRQRLLARLEELTA